MFGKYVSFLPFFGETTGVTLKGFKYPLSGKTLIAGISLGVSNEAEEDEMEVSFEKGYLGASFSLGYEFAISNGVGLQIRADCIAADFKDTGYRSCCSNNYYNFIVVLSFLIFYQFSLQLKNNL